MELLLFSMFHSLSFPDVFRQLQRDDDSLLIGARNMIYNISVHDLQENLSQRIEWFSKKHDISMCMAKGKSVDECQNYIRILAKEGEGRFLVCGTNAFKPMCRHYIHQTDYTFNFTEVDGVGKCPYNPRHRSTFVYVDGELYSGTMTDFHGTKPLIFRDPLKTDQNDYTQLNMPEFVHSFNYKDFVFYFFREIAVEYMKCGKRVYSRVGRVCKSDRGGRRVQPRFWTSFFKTRLNCSMPGKYPFYFDEIQATTDVISGVYGEVIYAVFTTPPNSIPGSAVCAFSMQSILDTFQSSTFNGLPVQVSVPEPRPGSCVENSQTLSRYAVNFAQTYSLMDEAVLGHPLFMRACCRFSRLVVAPKVTFLDGKTTVDVLFVATDTGTILKIIVGFGPVIVVEEIHVFKHLVSIVNLQLVGESRLIIITDDEVLAIPLHRCKRANNTCHSCVGLQDPYCAWYKEGGCGTAILGAGGLQNLSGYHSECPPIPPPVVVTSTTQQIPPASFTIIALLYITQMLSKLGW